ncbi:MAG: transporter permease [Frankiales bacterium]|nr:transporter permease [Frankiales bacterium]
MTAPAPDLSGPRWHRPAAVVGVLVAWLALFVVLRGRDTLELGAAQLTDLHRGLSGVADDIGGSRDTSLWFSLLLDPLREAVDASVTLLRDVLAQPSFGRPVPVVGWLGVAAVGTWLALALGGVRVAVLTAAGLLLLGLQGLFTEAMDTLALTVAAVVASLLVGIPLGIAAGVWPRVSRVVTPVLDLMQTMPTVVYLAPLTLLFLIGPASATLATLVYATPPVVRLTAHGVRGVPAEAVEAATSLGSSRLQTLRKVVLPLARRSIVLGVNQTTMAALSMVTIAALIDAPGLGKTVIKALQTLDVGIAFNAGLGIVVLAVVLDRVTTAASVRVETARRRSTSTGRRRLVALGVTGALALVAVQLSRTYVWAATFPETGVGPGIASGVDRATTAVQTRFSGLTGGTKDVVTTWLLDPLEALLTESPWWVVAAALLALATIVAGARATLVAAVCLALLLGTGLWEDAMTTLASTVLATVAVLALGVVVGVWMGRSRTVDGWLRPVLDAGQTMPAFVYLVPFLALFSASRFTAIVAAVVYAAPVAIKIVADGVRNVPLAAVEAATAVGSTRWQVITKVQLPLARRSLALATNQGLVAVLSMVVVGGLVGAGALGYDVVAGFSQSRLYGKGLAAGIAIVLLGILLDRVTQAAAARTGRRYAPPQARPRRRTARGLDRSAPRRTRRRGWTRATAHLARRPRRGTGPARQLVGGRPRRLRRRDDRRGLPGRERLSRLRDTLRDRRPRRQPLGGLRGQRRRDPGDR